MLTRPPRRSPWLLLVAAAITALLTGVQALPAAAAPTGRVAPLYGARSAGTTSGHYIVVLDQTATTRDRDHARATARRHGGRESRVYGRALQGFAATLPPAAVDQLRRDPRVKYVEVDRPVHLTGTETPATFGIDRIDQRSLPLDNSYTWTPDGTGVTAYVIDTGIRATHSEVSGRVGAGYTGINDGNGTNDCNGHGTHVAGTIGGRTYGVAKNVRLVPVRVFGCTGSTATSTIVAAVDWVTGNAVKPAVANMSLGGPVSQALDDAVTRSISAGIVYAVAAGNENTDACNGSPARTPAAITVGATTSADARASYSNYGTCLDLFAPGSGITSSWYTSDTATNTISGTSMATPHVAGVAALYLQTHPAATAQETRDAIVATATTGVPSGAGTGSPQRLLYSPLTGTGSATPPPATDPCALPLTYTGTLTGTGDVDIQPNGTYYYSASSGTHAGCLTGPSGTDFDLFLYNWNGSAWVAVARSEGTTSTERISYAGAPGYYYWRVLSYSGSGSYTLKVGHP